MILTVRGGSFDSWGGRDGNVFIVKKKIVQQITEKKYFVQLQLKINRLFSYLWKKQLVYEMIEKNV